MKYIEGELSIADKLWFNDTNGRCRLRICGFSKEQIEKLKNSSFIDITLVDIQGMMGEAYIGINEIKADEYGAEYGAPQDDDNRLDLMMENESEPKEEVSSAIWSEIRNTFTDEDTGDIYIDAWETDSDDEQGKVIAIVRMDGTVKYKDENAKTDEYAQEVILEAMWERLHRLYKWKQCGRDYIDYAREMPKRRIDTPSPRFRAR